MESKDLKERIICLLNDLDNSDLWFLNQILTLIRLRVDQKKKGGSE